MAEPRGWLGPALWAVAAITAARIVLLAFNQTDLFVDEAQYWLWGQDPSFGYFSKPPLIAWVIGATTALAGSDAPFWVRLPAPLFHAATALILAAIAARVQGPRAALVTALVFVTLPMVALGSLLISTDTIMFPFLALTLALYLPLTDRTARRPLLLATCAGIALGFAFLAKYAALYYLGLAAIAALADRRARPGPGAAAALLAAFALTIAPNLIWNLRNGLTTLAHTSDNIGWLRDGTALNLAGLAEFFAAQFAVFGPVLFAALLVATFMRPRGSGSVSPALLLVLSLPIVAIVCLQALLSKAYANWAAAAYLAGTLVVVPLLLRHPRWLTASFVVNGVVCLALPLATVFADSLWVGGEPVLKRYLGRAEMSRRLIAEAQAAGTTAIIAADRDILADLFYTGRDAPVGVFAWPAAGSPPHHYAQKYPYTGATDGPVLAVAQDDKVPPCARDLQPLTPITDGGGYFASRTLSLFVVPAGCWTTR